MNELTFDELRESMRKRLYDLGEQLEQWTEDLPPGIMFISLSPDEMKTVHSAILILRKEALTLQYDNARDEEK